MARSISSITIRKKLLGLIPETGMPCTYIHIPTSAAAAAFRRPVVRPSPSRRPPCPVASPSRTPPPHVQISPTPLFKFGPRRAVPFRIPTGAPRRRQRTPHGTATTAAPGGTRDTGPKTKTRGEEKTGSDTGILKIGLATATPSRGNYAQIGK